MLPPGHIAAGYLTAKIITSIYGSDLTQEQQHIIHAIGAFTGFAPDLDMFYAFSRVGRFIQPMHKVNHRKFFTHTPLFWIIIGLIVKLFIPGTFGTVVALVTTLGAFSHLLFDSILYGIMWLYPFSKNNYSLLGKGSHGSYSEHSFLGFWFGFLGDYVQRMKPIFYTEILLLITATFLFFN